MGFSSVNGYIPMSIEEMMDSVMLNYNAQFNASYTTETFLGTAAYKYWYALIQRLQANEIKTSEITLKIQKYFEITNELITRPNTTNPGIVDYFKAAGFDIAVKKPIDADAGKAYVCVDVDDSDPDYDVTKFLLCTLVSKCVVAGVISQGSEVEAITIPNDQSFDFKYNLPDRQPILLRLTITQSTNSKAVVLSDLEVTQILFDNINERYKLGVDFEPQKYFSVVDAPWASQVLLEYSLNAGADWESEVFESAYDDLFEFDIEDITVIEE